MKRQRTGEHCPACAGARDVFSQRDDTPGIDTALLILVDGSSSMIYGRPGGPSRIELAQTATWHIAKAAEAANAKLAIASFHTPQLTQAEMNNSACGALVRIVKPWHVPVSAYSISQIMPTLSTPLSAAILACSQISREYPRPGDLMVLPMATATWAAKR
jgi:hypothetical protein